MTEQDKIYAAGIVDGEGCITLTHHKNHTFQAMVSVVQKDVRLLNWLQERWGGRISHYANRAGVWRLEATNEQDTFLCDILPYLLLKQRQAEIILEYRLLAGNKGPVSDNNALTRWLLYQEVTTLNGWRDGKADRAVATTEQIRKLETQLEATV